MTKAEQNVLVLQGGGALGAYQAGVFQTVAEGGFDVDWIAAISIGAPLQYVVENPGANLLCTFSDRRRPRGQGPSPLWSTMGRDLLSSATAGT
jgi:NTE family protein